MGAEPVALWHGDADLRGADAVLVPGGFSYGDYLRPGPWPPFSPVMREVGARRGGAPGAGVCNGFQVLCETRLLPGVLLPTRASDSSAASVDARGGGLRPACSPRARSPGKLALDSRSAHHDGTCDFAPTRRSTRLEAAGQVAFRYRNENGDPAADANPNGCIRDVAGVTTRPGTCSA